MRTIVDMYFNKTPQPKGEQKQQRNFGIMCRAFALGIYSTDATLDELFAMAATITDMTIDDLVIKICNVEGPNAKYTI